MSVKEEKKEELINMLNQNYRTILSYGNGGLVPMGEFIVKDIIKDEIPTEFSNTGSQKRSGTIILAKIDDESVQIVLPVQTYLTDFFNIAKKNARILSKTIDFAETLKRVERKAERKVFEDETLENLVDAETISLDESEASYLVNGEIQSTNYSICPIEVGKHREREIER